MSFDPVDWIRDLPLPAVQKLILLMLHTYRHPGSGLGDPAAETLARHCGLKRSALFAQLKKMKQAGVIIAKRQSHRPSQLVIDPRYAPKGEWSNPKSGLDCQTSNPESGLDRVSNPESGLDDPSNPDFDHGAAISNPESGHLSKKERKKEGANAPLMSIASADAPDAHGSAAADFSLSAEETPAPPPVPPPQPTPHAEAVRKPEADKGTLFGSTTSARTPNGAGKAPRARSEGAAADKGQAVWTGDRAIVWDAWNAMAAQTGLAGAVAQTKTRKAALDARLREHGIDGVLEAIDKIGRSSFCHGGGNAAWKADFDFLTQPTSLTAAREGRYDDRIPSLSARTNGTRPRNDPMGVALAPLSATLTQTLAQAMSFEELCRKGTRH